MKDIYSVGLRGRLPCFIEEFLTRQKIWSSNWFLLLRLLWSGNGCTSRQHSFRYSPST